MARVKTSVERIVMAKGPDDVEVDVYPDMEWTTPGGGWSRASSGLMIAQKDGDGFDAAGLLRTYAPQAGLATLALISVLMMMRIARRSSDAVASRRAFGPESGLSPEEEPLLTIGPTSVGQAEVSETFLAGKELDPDTLRYQELAQEVSKMVEKDPEGTADLLRKWIGEI
jgi:hypothetical protein